MRSVTGRAGWVSAAAIGMVFGMTLLLAACGSSGSSTKPTPTPLPGTVLDPPKAVVPFTLTGQDGTPFDITSLHGQAVVVYFGYTNCPDVCPTTLSAYKQVKAALGADAEHVAFVFISVDGPRDTPERLKLYLGAFDPTFIGLSGDDAAIRAVAQDFGVFFQRVVSDKTQENYLVDHTASTFVLDADGNLRLILPYGTDPAIMAQRIQDDVLRG